MRGEALAGIVLVVLMVGPASAAPYLQWAGSADRSGALSDPGPATDDVAFAVELPGRDAGAYGGALIFGRTVYALTDRDESHPGHDTAGLFAIGLDDGSVRMLHHNDMGSDSMQGLVSDGDSLFVVTAAGVTAVRASDGAALWETRHPQLDPTANRTGCGGSALSAGVLYIYCRQFRNAAQASDGYAVAASTLFVSAIDPHSGKVLWTRQPTKDALLATAPLAPSSSALAAQTADPNYIEQAVTVVGSTVILTAMHADTALGTPRAAPSASVNAAGPNEHVWAYTSDGAFAWEKGITSVYDDYNGHTTASDAAEWARYPESNFEPSVAGDEQDVFFAGSSDLFAYRTTTGAAEWYAKIPEAPSSDTILNTHTIALSHGQILVTTGSGGFYVFDRATHALVANATGLPTSNCYCPILVANSTAYHSRETSVAAAALVSTASLHDITATTLSGAPLWTDRFEVDGGYRGLRTSIGDGVMTLFGGDGTLRVLGRTGASMTANARISTLYPRAFENVSVDLSRSLPGAFGPATRFRAFWGDGDATDWQTSPILHHKYTEAKPATARFFVANDANQTASVLVKMHVGELAPSDSLLAAIFAPERQNITFGVIGLAATGAGGLIAILARQRRRTLLARELAALEELRTRTKRDERAWILGVEEKRAHHAALLRRRRIDSGELLVLERRIEVLSLMAGPAGAKAEVGATLLGRYRLDRLLGEGGQGRAFLARDELIGRDVVVKTVRTQGLDGGARRALVAEARLAGSIDHANVVRVLDVIDGANEAYLILEYVEGGTLRALMRKGPLPRAEALRLFRGIAAGLAAAHARGVVHGDIKPENVLLARDGTPKLADFGTAREAATEATIGAIPSGTLRYMAPEQVRGRAADARSDVYAATAILAEMLTGRPLFGSAPLDDFQLRARILDGAHDTAGIPEALAALVARGLAADPDARYRSGAELLGGIP